MSQRISDLTFDGIADLIHESSRGDLLDDFDHFLSAVLVLTPAFTGNPATWALIEPKNELTKLGRRLVSAVLPSGQDDHLTRHRRLAAAHCLLCYTAFFDAARRTVTAANRALRLSPRE